MNAFKPLVGDPSKRLGEAFIGKINHKDPRKKINQEQYYGDICFRTKKAT